MELQTIFALLGALGLISGTTAQAAQADASQTPAEMDREKEIALALSACPPSVAPGAAVYVLDKSGYVKVRESRNGFTAIVTHGQPTSQEPQCMDAEGARLTPALSEGGGASGPGQNTRRD
jgi:hypothetical protein